MAHTTSHAASHTTTTATAAASFGHLLINVLFLGEASFLIIKASFLTAVGFAEAIEDDAAFVVAISGLTVEGGFADGAFAATTATTFATTAATTATTTTAATTAFATTATTAFHASHTFIQIGDRGVGCAFLDRSCGDDASPTTAHTASHAASHTTSHTAATFLTAGFGIAFAPTSFTAAAAAAASTAATFDAFGRASRN